MGLVPEENFKYKLLNDETRTLVWQRTSEIKSLKGCRAGAITIEPIKIGIELVNKATAARIPDVAIKTK